MARDKYKDVPAWKRPQRNSWVVTVSIILLLVCSLFLLVQAYWMDLRLRAMEEQVEQLQGTVKEQQLQLQGYIEKGNLNSELVIEGMDKEAQQEVQSVGQTTASSDEVPAEDTQSDVASEGNENSELTNGQGDMDLEGTQEAISGAVESMQGAAHKVYLTFDDGPSVYTDDILDILAAYNVKATFFVVGKEESFNEEMLNRIVDEGHTLGLHSYSHKYAEIYESVEAFTADFKKLQDAVYEATGYRSHVYRFPGGSSNQVSQLDMQEFVEYLESQKVQFYDWNVSAGDGASELLDVDTIVENCTRNITQRGTTIVLMHDSADKPTTMEALPKIIEKIQAMEDTEILPITEDTAPMHHLETD